MAMSGLRGHRPANSIGSGDTVTSHGCGGVGVSLPLAPPEQFLGTAVDPGGPIVVRVLQLQDVGNCTPAPQNSLRTYASLAQATSPAVQHTQPPSHEDPTAIEKRAHVLDTRGRRLSVQDQQPHCLSHTVRSPSSQSQGSFCAFTSAGAAGQTSLSIDSEIVSQLRKGL